MMGKIRFTIGFYSTAVNGRRDQYVEFFAATDKMVTASNR